MIEWTVAEAPIRQGEHCPNCSQPVRWRRESKRWAKWVELHTTAEWKGSCKCSWWETPWKRIPAKRGGPLITLMDLCESGVIAPLILDYTFTAFTWPKRRRVKNWKRDWQRRKAARKHKRGKR